MSHYLVGDIGGTKTRLAVAQVRGTHVQIVREFNYRSRDYATFEELLEDFLSRSRCSLSPQSRGEGTDGQLQIHHAAFGVAGPVQGKIVRTTNLPWVIDGAAMQNRYGFPNCTLLNDLEATAYGLPALGENDLFTLQQGSPVAGGNVAVIAAGTGLGEAGLFWDGSALQPFATEGGHASFSPDNELDMAFLRYLQQRYRHISWERVVSGMGLSSMQRFLCAYRNAELPQWLLDKMRNGDAVAEVAKAALSGSDDICVETLNWFVRLYGAESSNLALKLMSRGGLYLGGGIAPKILPILRNGIFLQAFLNKGRMRRLLEAIPVRVILNDCTALYGPALRAAQLDELSS
jgi:glucokinase